MKSKALDNKATISTSPHCVIAFHMYLEDFLTDGWKKITSAPVKEVALRFSEGSAMFISPPWSRQWLHDRKSIAKENATHVSFIARVYKRSVTSLYRQSGHNSVFVNPLRTGNEKPDEICSVIWVGDDRQVVAQMALKRQEQLGLVRSWKKGFGIRVLTTEFDVVFSEIKPGEEKPDLKGGDKIFRAQPFPPAMTLGDVREWLGKVAWKAAPIKILGGGSAIISAEEGPSSTFLPLNDGFVLVKEIRAKTRRDPSTVAAGRWTAPHQTGIDPLVAHDPWAAAKRGAGPTVAVAPPQDQGKVDKHDRQIHDIQAAIKELQNNQSKASAESASFRKEVTAEITGFQHRITHEVKSMAGVFSQSLQDALSKQETRFDGIIRLGHFDVILITIYGVPSSKGSSANQEILRQAFDIISSSSSLPSLVVGDFNEPPQGIATVCPFLHLGFIEIFDWCGKTLGKKPPPTCKDVTYNDFMLVHPMLIPFIKDVQVDPLSKIDVHSPLFVTFDITQAVNTWKRWKVPCSWAHKELDQDTLEQSYIQVSGKPLTVNPHTTQQDILDSFRQWSTCVEAAVNRALQRDGTLEQGGLHPSERGRCSWDDTKQQCRLLAGKTDWMGGYNPPCETTSLRSAQRVRQTRRLLGLFRSMQAALKRDRVPDELRAQWRQEWYAIKNAKGYGASWVNWILKDTDCVAVPCELPDLDTVHDLLQYNRFDSDAFCKREISARRDAKAMQ